MIRDVKIDDICWQLPKSWRQEPDGLGKRFCELENTPHFKALNGDDAEYLKYVKKYFSGEDGLNSPEKKLKAFKTLAVTLEYLKGTGSRGEDYETDNDTYHIKLTKNKAGQYYAVDGDHRLAILKHRGDKVVSCKCW